MALVTGRRNTRPIANLFPAGSLLYLEARDFRSILSEWNNSSEKKLWLTSDNYQVFSRTIFFSNSPMHNRSSRKQLVSWPIFRWCRPLQARTRQ